MNNISKGDVWVGNNEVEGLCPSCYGGIMYYKRDWLNLKASPIPLTFKILFKGNKDGNTKK